MCAAFEKMASIDADNAHSGLKSSLGKAEKGVSGNKPTGMKEEANLGLYEGNEIKGTNRHGAAKEDLMAIIARLSSRVEETEKDLATLAEKVRKL